MNYNYISDEMKNLIKEFNEIINCENKDMSFYSTLVSLINEGVVCYITHIFMNYDYGRIDISTDFTNIEENDDINVRTVYEVIEMAVEMDFDWIIVNDSQTKLLKYEIKRLYSEL